jgi:hypothetical protein
MAKQTMIVVLVGQGGELDRREFSTRKDILTFADLADVCGDWIMGDGDVVRVRDKEMAETADL